MTRDRLLPVLGAAGIMMFPNVAGKDRPHSLRCLWLLLAYSIYLLETSASDVWRPPPSGFATITHYTLPLNYIASKILL
jgi:hypothetical protein